MNKHLLCEPSYLDFLMEGYNQFRLAYPTLMNLEKKNHSDISGTNEAPGTVPSKQLLRVALFVCEGDEQGAVPRQNKK